MNEPVSTTGDNAALLKELESVVEIIKNTRGQRFVDRFEALGFDRRVDLAGGDWRNCDFSNSDLTDVDFRNSRLYRANFRHSQVTNADFRGAGDVHTTSVHLSYGWRDAYFEDYQIILIEAEIAKMHQHHDRKKADRFSTMDEKDWFYVVKACPSFSEAESVLKQMELAGHELNPYAYSYLLDRAKRDRKRREGWLKFKEFFERGGEADEALYTAGIGVSPNSKIALAVFEQLKAVMAARNEFPGDRAYNMAISEQDDNFTVALGLFHEMKRKHVKISRYTIYALFDACADFANAVSVLIEARQVGIDINDETFLEELTNTTRYPDLSEWNIQKWKAEGLSARDLIVKLISELLFEPFRSVALESLN